MVPMVEAILLVKSTSCFYSHYIVKLYLLSRGARLRASALLMRSILAESGGLRPSNNRFGLVSKNCEMRANVVTANGNPPCSIAPIVCTWTPANSARHSCVIPTLSLACRMFRPSTRRISRLFTPLGEHLHFPY